MMVRSVGGPGQSYGVDAESIHKAEAYWNGDRESPKVVKLDGRISGRGPAISSSADVAAIGRAALMEKKSIINRIRSVLNSDGTVPELTRAQQLEFLRDPCVFLENGRRLSHDAIIRESRAA